MGSDVLNIKSDKVTLSVANAAEYYIQMYAYYIVGVQQMHKRERVTSPSATCVQKAQCFFVLQTSVLVRKPHTKGAMFLRFANQCVSAHARCASHIHKFHGNSLHSTYDEVENLYYCQYSIC